MSAPVEIFFGADGLVRAVCSDELEDLGIFEELGGRRRTYRVSDVEATEDGQWEASLARVAGPVLGPFGRRREALAAEDVWIRGELDAGTFRSPEGVARA